MKKITVTMPGKVLISGEHSVVLGGPALVASIDKKMKVDIKPAKGFYLVSKNQDKLELVPYALEMAGVEPKTVKVIIESDIPAGMGTSAAVCAGVIKAAYEFMGKELSEDEWFRLTWESEKKAHGNSSGVDPAAVIYKGLIWYIRDKERQHLRISRIYPLVLVDTGKPSESTGEMVASVAAKLKGQNAKFKSVLHNIVIITREIRNMMELGGEVGELINENGRLLEKLEVVGGKAKDISRKLRRMGYGVKITGAGGVKTGSGRLIVVGARLKSIQDLGYEAFEVKIGGT